MTRYTEKGAREVRRATEDQVRRLAEAVKEGEAMNEAVLHEWEYRFNRYRLLSKPGAPIPWVERQTQSDWIEEVDRLPGLAELARLADLLRPRYPARGELPADNERVLLLRFYGDGSGPGLAMGRIHRYADGALTFFDDQTHGDISLVVCWWPAPALPSPEGAESAKVESA